MTNPLRVLMLEGPSRGPDSLLQELESEDLSYEIHRDEARRGFLANPQE